MRGPVKTMAGPARHRGPTLDSRNDAGELYRYAKANPGKLKLGFAGVGRPQHIGIEMFKVMADVDITLVPYLGSSAALADLLTGKIDGMFDPMPSSIAHIKAGRLIPLAVTTLVKSAALPNVPTASDLVARYQAGSWFGIVAGRETSSALVEKLNRTINAAFLDAGITARLAELGALTLPGSPAQFQAFVQSETAKYAEVIRLAKISPRAFCLLWVDFVGKRDRDDIEKNALEAAAYAARRLSAVIALKGSITHIVSFRGDWVLNDRGTIGLATSGSGDTLAGIIAGLIARGAALFLATAWGVYLHAAAGRNLVQRIGPVGLVTRERTDEIPMTMRDLSD